MDAANFICHHPAGNLYGWFTSDGLAELLLPPIRGSVHKVNLTQSAPNIQDGRLLAAALDRYLAGIVEDFSDIPLDLRVGTAFQQEVWNAARDVPWGETISYGELAARIGRPKAARAVGQALGANPVPIVVPCHRFIAADGSLGGFGCGLEWKRYLLNLEKTAVC